MTDTKRDRTGDRTQDLAREFAVIDARSMIAEMSYVFVSALGATSTVITSGLHRDDMLLQYGGCDPDTFAVSVTLPRELAMTHPRYRLVSNGGTIYLVCDELARACGAPVPEDDDTAFAAIARTPVTVTARQ